MIDRSVLPDPHPPSGPGRRVLVLFAHPALEKSRVNRVLIRGLAGMDRVTFHDLYESYADLDIDVPREQGLLATHDVIVFHHPFFWYSTPSIVKEWLDLVLEHGWAYGHEGTALRGKVAMTAVTTGGRETAYRPDGYNAYTVRQLLAPMEQTAKLCGMTYLAPFVAHGTHAMERPEMEAHAADYRRVLAALRDDRLDLAAAADPELGFLNADLDRLIREER